MKQDLIDIVKKVREDLKNRREIKGHCIQNSKFLTDYIEKNTDYNTEIVKGAVDYEKEPTPNSYERAKKDGTLHHWVIVENTLHCNLIREVPYYYHSKKDSILVSKDKPSYYIDFGLRFKT